MASSTVTCTCPRRGRWLAGRGVDREVTDQKDRPAGRDASTEPSHHLSHRCVHVHVQTADQVKVPRRRHPTPKIALNPFDIFGDVGTDRLGHSPSVFKGGRREVDCGDPPSRRREPDRLRAVATARIERKSWGHISNLGDEVGIRWTTRHLVGMLSQHLRPSRFPKVPIERLVGHEWLASADLLGSAACATSVKAR
jgi:hypothetical protein